MIIYVFFSFFSMSANDRGYAGSPFAGVNLSEDKYTKCGRETTETDVIGL